MKKKEKKVEYEEIGQCYADSYSKCDIPEGATHFELKVDYSNCYYESDTPSYTMYFFKLKS